MGFMMSRAARCSGKAAQQAAEQTAEQTAEHSHGRAEGLLGLGGKQGCFSYIEEDRGGERGRDAAQLEEAGEREEGPKHAP